MTSSLEFLTSSRRRTPFIPQGETSECALACIAMIAGHHGHEIDLASLRQRFNISMKGATLTQIATIADALNLRARPVKASLQELSDVSLPAILHWDLNHFVVLAGVMRTRTGNLRYEIIDPARSASIMDRSEVSKHFTGVAVEIAQTEQFRTEKQIHHLQLRQLWSRISGFWSSIRNLFVLSLILQAITLISPFYLQLAVDEAVPGSDNQMLNALAIGFGGLVFLNYLTTWLRTSMALSFSTSLSYQLVNNLFGHFVRLPTQWFTKRHVGDVISRFGSTQPVSQLLSQGMLTSAIDGLLATTTLVLMLVYSPLLSAIAGATLTLYLLARLLFFETLRLHNINSIAAAARENSVFIETARGIQTIKAFGHESVRQQVWQKAKIDAVNAQFKLGRLSSGFDCISQFVVAAEQILFVLVAMNMAIDGSLTLGMVFAFQAYKQQFVGAGIRLIEQGVNWKVLRIHLSRISDIALSPPENPRSSGALVGNSPSRIELSNIHFRYGMGERNILNSVSLAIEPEEFVVLIGPSGGGKTTVGKIITGLLDPTAGEVLFDGRPLAQYSLASLRQSIATVSQDDVLYAGTLADNISFWDANIDIERLHKAAQDACIHDDIQRMPLGYDTLVGDMGAALSGGQKSRVLIARALYRSPQLLLLDEATAQLDPGVERQVVENIAKLNLTRIFITHRAQPARYADRIIRVEKGRVIPVRQGNMIAAVAG